MTPTRRQSDQARLPLYRVLHGANAASLQRLLEVPGVPEAVIAVAVQDHFARLLQHRLTSAPAKEWGQLLQNWAHHEALSAAARAEGFGRIAYKFAVETELRRLGQDLEQAGIQVLGIKGFATTRTIYDNPSLRPHGDIDLMVDRSKIPALVDLLQRHGFNVSEHNLFDMTHFDAQKTLPGGIDVWLDVHSGIRMIPALRDKYSFQEIWAESLPVAGLPNSVRCPSRPWLALIAAVHFTTDDVTYPFSKGLLDLSVCIQRMTAGELERLCDITRAGRLGGIVHGALQMAAYVSDCDRVKHATRMLEALRRQKDPTRLFVALRVPFLSMAIYRALTEVGEGSAVRSWVALLSQMLGILFPVPQSCARDPQNAGWKKVWLFWRRLIHAPGYWMRGLRRNLAAARVLSLRPETYEANGTVQS